MTEEDLIFPQHSRLNVNINGARPRKFRPPPEAPQRFTQDVLIFFIYTAGGWLHTAGKAITAAKGQGAGGGGGEGVRERRMLGVGFSSSEECQP